MASVSANLSLTCVIHGGALAVSEVPVKPQGDVVPLPALGAWLAARAVHIAVDSRRSRRRRRRRRRGSPRSGPRGTSGAGVGREVAGTEALARCCSEAGRREAKS